MSLPSATSSGVKQALARYRTAFVAIVAVSAVLNVLLLGGSLYMMLVYDSVLPSRSIPTLVGLFGMITAVYLFQGFLGGLRARILSGIAAGVDRSLALRVQQAVAEARLRGVSLPGDGLMAMRDVDDLRNFLAGSGPIALIDMPWIVLFVGVLFLLHPLLGVAALAGAVVLIALAVLTDRLSHDPSEHLGRLSALRHAAAQTNVRHAELLSALGMRERFLHRWEGHNRAYLDATNRLTGVRETVVGASRVFRMFLQSGLLSVGALLVIDGKASGGVIIASSVLSSRALAPVEQAIANWRGYLAARTGWRRIDALLAAHPTQGDDRIALPAPSSALVVEDLRVAPPGSDRLTVDGVGFRLVAGDALGIVGPSAAGKTSLARALVGAWRPQSGAVRLDGAALDQWRGAALGRHIGYLPQAVDLLDGTVAQNIARFEDDPDPQALIAAAKAAGVHDMIVGLPHGYQTPVGQGGAELSGGQRQRIGLARALYRDPFLVLLDEPNANLDPDGDRALDTAIAAVRARGGIVIVIAHRPSALAHVDQVLVMRDGRVETLAPRDEVMARIAPGYRMPARAARTVPSTPAEAIA